MADPPKKRRPRILRVGSQGKRLIGTRRGEVYQKATSSEMIHLFSEARIEERARSGELTFQITYNEHPSPPLAGEPICTRSQLLEYYDRQGEKVALIHRYLRPDNTIGLSGKHDPKEVLQNGVRYYSDAS